MSRRSQLAARLARLEQKHAGKTMALHLLSGRVERLHPRAVLQVMSAGLPWLANPDEHERPEATRTVRLLAQADPERHRSMLMATALSVARAVVEGEAS